MKHLILVFFSIFLFSTNSFAANKTQLQKWNESPISNVRNQVANQNAGTFSEIPTSQRTIKAIEAKVDTGKVQALIEDKTNYKGSLGKTYVATEIPYSAESAAKTWAGRLGKLRGGTIPAIVGSIAFDQFMKGVGWMMDDGSKVITKPVVHGGSYSIHGTNNKGASWDEAGEVFCYNWKNYFGSSSDCKFFGVSKKVSSNNDIDYYEVNVCFTNSGSCQGVTGANNTQISDGYFFKQNSTTTNQELTNQEIEDAIKDYLSRNPKSQISADLLRYAYTLQDPNGNPTDDPKKADPNNNDSPREITNATNDVLKSNDPLAICSRL